MKPIAAIVEQHIDIELIGKQLIVWIADEHQADASGARHEQLAAAARETAKARRLDIGKALRKVRAAWPERGPKAKGWGEFLALIGLEQSTAWRYMHPEQAAAAERPPAAPEPQVSCAPHERPIADRDVTPVGPPQLALVPPPAAEPEVEIDRDTWCTPGWLTAAIGTFDLDPCSNERSTVSARTTMDLERGVDGLAHAEDVEPDWRVFVNPPYSDVPPWIAAYGHTRFCFLLKLDTSTRWFADLFARTQLILIPRKRIQFDPPPGVPPESAKAQQFPHALFYARETDATPEIRALCWAWRVDPTT